MGEQPNRFLNFRDLFRNGRCDDVGHTCPLLSLPVPRRLDGYEVNPVKVAVVLLISELIDNVQGDQKGTCQSHGKAKQVDETEGLIADKAAEEDLEVVLEH